LVVVKDQKGAAVAGATVATTWNLPPGITQNQTASTNLKGNANFDIRGGPGVYTVTITNISKDGYTFDAANSVLSKSITKVKSLDSRE
jgi:DnaJ-class molecular chaperone